MQGNKLWAEIIPFIIASISMIVVDKGCVWKDERTGESILEREKSKNKSKHPGPFGLLPVTVQETLEKENTFWIDDNDRTKSTQALFCSYWFRLPC